MANSYFKFKQFTIHQDNTSMKVCTDACIFGAWVTVKYNDAEHVLDIGSGTGLLSLMYAQQNLMSRIDAVEIDANAATQASENITKSPWHNRINIHQADIQAFTTSAKYNLIITNPPFFENDLHSLKAGRNNAMHDTTLTLSQLIDTALPHLSQAGTLAVLLPFHRMQYFIEMAEKAGLHLVSRLLVKQTMNHSYFRSILCFSHLAPHNVIEEDLVIKESDDQYSFKFNALLKDYYLYL